MTIHTAQEIFPSSNTIPIFVSILGWILNYHIIWKDLLYCLQLSKLLIFPKTLSRRECHLYKQYIIIYYLLYNIYLRSMLSAFKLTLL